MHIQASLLHSYRDKNEITNPPQVFQLNPWLSYKIERYILVWIKYLKETIFNLSNLPIFLISQVCISYTYITNPPNFWSNFIILFSTNGPLFKLPKQTGI